MFLNIKIKKKIVNQGTSLKEFQQIPRKKNYICQTKPSNVKDDKKLLKSQTALFKNNWLFLETKMRKKTF